MKELYNKPELTVDEFKLVDVMTESQPGIDTVVDNDDPEGDGW
jgi:hypothetical protein